MKRQPRTTEPTLREIIETEASEAVDLAKRLKYAAGALEAGGCASSAVAVNEARQRILWAQREIMKLRYALEGAVDALKQIRDMAPVVQGNERTAWDRGYSEGYAEAVEYAVNTARAGMPDETEAK